MRKAMQNLVLGGVLHLLVLLRVRTSVQAKEVPVPLTRAQLLERFVFLFELDMKSWTPAWLDIVGDDPPTVLFTADLKEELEQLISELGSGFKSELFSEACEVLGNDVVMDIQAQVMQLINKQTAYAA